MTKTYFKITGIVFLAALVLGFIIPPAVNSLAVKNCRSVEQDPFFQTCETQRPWLQFLQGVSFAGGYIASPLWLGIFLGLTYVTGRTRNFRKNLAFSFLAISGLMLALAAFEIILLQPWNSPPHNTFTGDALFGTPWFALTFWVIGLMGLFFTSLFSPQLWKRFRPLGFLQTNKFSNTSSQGIDKNPKSASV